MSANQINSGVQSLKQILKVIGVSAVATAFAFTGLAQAPPPVKAPAPQAAPPQLVPQMPGGTPAKPYHFPPVAAKTLANGMRVFVVSSPDMPAVTVRLVLTSAGAVNDPEGKPGVAEMTAGLLAQGTPTRTAQQIAEAIDFVGGTLSANADYDSTGVSITVVKKDFDLAMDLLSDVTLHANFQKDELERQRQQALSNLRINYDDPDFLASTVFARVVYGMHPYGLPNEGTPGSIQTITQNDLVAFRDSFYSPGKALLAFAGDITPEAAFAAAEKFFGVWQNKPVPAQNHAAAGAGAGMHIYVVDRPDAVQTQIRIGRLGIRRNDPDFIPLFVADRIFGGSYNSRLNTEVRIKKGLTYGANSEFDSRLETGSLMASTFTRTEATMDAVRLVMNLLQGMSKGDLKPEELSFAKDYLMGVYPIQTETPEQVANRVLTVAHYGLPADYNETYQLRISGVTLAQANAEAMKYYQTASLEIVLAGNAAQFRADLKKEFPNASYDEIPAGQLDVLLPGLRRKPEPIPAATPEALAQGKTLLIRAIQAAGGAAIVNVQSIECASAGMVDIGQVQPATTTRKLTILYPDRMRLDTKVFIGGADSGTLTQSFDGKDGWVQFPGGQGAVSVAETQTIEFVRNILLAGGWGLFRAAQQGGGIQAQSLGQRDFAGQKTDALAIAAGAMQFIVYLDPAAGLVMGVRYIQEVQQAKVETVEVWTDYRDVQGMKFPFHRVTLRAGQKFSDDELQEVKINTNPSPNYFVKPQ
jgi:zinc protease